MCQCRAFLGLRRRTAIGLLLYALFAATGCEKAPAPILEEQEPLLTTPKGGPLRGLYVLNEGNMGSNKATLDFVDYDAQEYRRNIYSQRNPNVVKELGDVGNDVGVYGQRLYVVVNASGKVEVLNAKSAKRIGQVDIKNCRSVAFHGPNAYITSYVGPILIDENAPIGMLYEVDTATLAIRRTCQVGYQPDGVAIVDGKAYVANSGGYRVPHYDRHISVVDLATMTVERNVDVAINLNLVKLDAARDLWVTSRGDYGAVPPRLHLLRRATGYTNPETLDISCTGFDFLGDSLLYYGHAFNATTAKWSVEYGIVSRKTRELVSPQLITDGSQARIKTPYAICVDPYNRTFYIADAKGYTSSGELFCFSANGKLLWTVRTGDIPGHFAFLRR